MLSGGAGGEDPSFEAKFFFLTAIRTQLSGHKSPLFFHIYAIYIMKIFIYKKINKYSIVYHMFQLITDTS